MRTCNRKAWIFTIAVFCLTAMSVSGCSRPAIKQFIRPGVDSSGINRIAVLPFENFTSDEYADENVRSLVIIDLLSRGVDVVEPGEVARTLKELKIWSINSLSEQDRQNIGKRLNVEALMLGSVGSYKMSKGISVTFPDVSVYLTIYESGTGTAIWSVWNTSGGADFMTRHFGMENATLSETSKKVIKESIDTFF